MPDILIAVLIVVLVVLTVMWIGIAFRMRLPWRNESRMRVEFDLKIPPHISFYDRFEAMRIAADVTHAAEIPALLRARLLVREAALEGLEEDYPGVRCVLAQPFMVRLRGQTRTPRLQMG
jgi:hypothetical protein